MSNHESSVPEFTSTLAEVQMQPPNVSSTKSPVSKPALGRIYENLVPLDTLTSFCKLPEL